MANFIRRIPVFALAVVVLSCGSDSPTSQWASTFPSGMAVASLTAATAARGVRATARATALEGDETFSEKAEVFEAILTKAAAGGCNITLPNLGGFSARAECYGPQVNYANHPNGSGGSGQFPTGDLGLWEATEGGTEACASAQINELMATTSIYIDTALMLEASAICLLDTAGTAIPSVGGSADFTSDFETSLKVNNPSATATNASVTQTATDLFEYSFSGTTDGAKAYDVTIRIKKTDASTYQGRIFGYFTTMNKDAFSTTFSRSGTDLKVRMVAGSWLGAAADSSIFSSGGDLIQDDSFHGSMNQAIVDVNLDTLAGNLSYAWQAGSGDDKTRVFNAYTTVSGSDVSGCGFFGYGNDFEADYASNTNAIDGFICNWAGPGNDHSMSSTSGKAQKQCFQSDSSGVMAEVTGKRAITYAPNVACNDTTAFTYDFPAHSADGATNNLITLSSDPDYASFSAPSAPTLDSGI